MELMLIALLGAVYFNTLRFTHETVKQGKQWYKNHMAEALDKVQRYKDSRYWTPALFLALMVALGLDWVLYGIISAVSYTINSPLLTVCYISLIMSVVYDLYIGYRSFRGEFIVSPFKVKVTTEGINLLSCIILISSIIVKMVT